MDDSVIFVRQLRPRNSDVVFINSSPGTGTDSAPHAPPNNLESYPIRRSSRSRLNTQGKTKSSTSHTAKKSQAKSNKTKRGPQAPAENNENTFCCPVCLEHLAGLDIQVINCGHMFCKQCLSLIVSKPLPPCPICRRGIIKSLVIDVYPTFTS